MSKRESGSTIAAKSASKTLNITPKSSSESTEEALARALLRPAVQASITLTEYYKDVGPTSLGGLIQELGTLSNAASGGDLGRVEAMLVAQAHTLDAIFNKLARRAARAEYAQQLDVNLRLALKAQSQSRATIETLANMKNPRPVAFVGQANISAGPQQVNNSAAAPPRARARVFEAEQDRLLEAQNVEGLDAGTPSCTVGGDSEMAAVGPVHRTAHR